MKVKSFTFNPFQENTYVLYDDTKEAVIVDPGCYNNTEENELLQFINENNLKPVRLLNTHGHIDHVFGNAFVASQFNLDLELHEMDLEILKMAKIMAEKYGLEYTVSPLPGRYLSEREEIKFGNTALEIRFVPGHAPGHVVFYETVSKQLIGGDVLFQGSIGRTDLPGGNHEDLLESIRNQVFTLPDEVVVYPGHGPSTNVGFEKKNNPFFT